MVSLSTRAASSVAALGLAVGGLLFSTAAPATAVQAPNGCQAYGAPATTTTTVSISPANPSVGQQFTATARVTSGGQPVTSGTVIFSYRGEQLAKPVDSSGEASVKFTARQGNQTVTVRYRETCIAGTAALGGSNTVQVLGVEQFAPPKTDDQASVGGLAATGLEPAVQLMALTGAGLLTAGAATFVIRRRRVTI